MCSLKPHIWITYTFSQCAIEAAGLNHLRQWIDGGCAHEIVLIVNIPTKERDVVRLNSGAEPSSIISRWLESSVKTWWIEQRLFLGLRMFVRLLAIVMRLSKSNRMREKFYTDAFTNQPIAFLKTAAFTVFIHQNWDLLSRWGALGSHSLNTSLSWDGFLFACVNFLPTPRQHN